jgi:hypothetical protein
MHTYIHTHTRMHTYIQACMHAHIHTHTHTHTNTRCVAKYVSRMTCKSDATLLVRLQLHDNSIMVRAIESTNALLGLRMNTNNFLNPTDHLDRFIQSFIMTMWWQYVPELRPQVMYEEAYWKPWWNDIDRGNLLNCLPELCGNPTSSHVVTN